MKKLMVLAGIIILLQALPLWAQSPEQDAVLGEKLVREIFANPSSVKLARAFQAVHEEGVRDHDAEARMLKSIMVSNYTLANFKITREANILIVTYTFTGHEIIDGRKMSRKPAPRLSVFINTGKEWQWLAHANLIAARK